MLLQELVKHASCVIAMEWQFDKATAELALFGWGLFTFVRYTAERSALAASAGASCMD